MEERTRIANARVLLAEDNAVNREVAVAMLQGFGCEVEVAKNGREAVAAVDRGRFDLILMDCQMPEMDGFEATRVLREAEAARAGTAGAARVRSLRLPPTPWKATANAASLRAWTTISPSRSSRSSFGTCS